tara:strand:- start:33566 stop:34525 length:960 start_codon:yes stop_codon:yes gene_type:complete
MDTLAQPTTAKDELISKLVNKSLSLSYSSLKNFTTPRDFIEYKLKPYKPNPSMIFGSVCDCLILTPEDFDKDFKIIPSIPSTENQVGFADALIEIGKTTELTEEIIELEFTNHYKRGRALDVFAGLQAYIMGSVSGKTLITQDIYDEAFKVSQDLLSKPDIDLIFQTITDVQKKVEFDYEGWTFKGFYDILTPTHIIDLKFSRDSNPEKFERDIANYDYFLQAALYVYAAKVLGILEDPRYSFIVYDKAGNYSIIELDYTYIVYGTKKFKYLVQELDRCIAEGAFDESYNFFQRTYKCYKPNWAKGFALDEEEYDDQAA